MPAATTRADLIAVTETEWAKLARLLDTVPDSLAAEKDAEETSITDILAHRAHWIGLFFKWLGEGRAGGPVHMPDDGVKWNELKRYNADLRARYADLGWAAARRRLAEAHDRLLSYMQEADEAELYGGPMPGGTGWTIGRYAEAAGPSHYRSAAKYIRSRLKAG